MMIKNEIAAMFGLAELMILAIGGTFLILVITALVLLIRYLMKKNTGFKKEDFR
ncbi:hypothetical protein [Pedobacter frigoris]|uniref:hypothetical protein n=1 Tax=Pedobacter frigoris TaxID=2571272 RepID=UPI00145D005E|nr:hypothetical protein [Pedobacter frigoris]